MGSFYKKAKLLGFEFLEKMAHRKQNFVLQSLTNSINS
jgi:hypothetical protein